MKRINVLYWVFTLLFAFIMIFTSIPSIRVTPEAIGFMNGKLGYPEYFIPFTGVAKVLGIIAILVPGFPVIKEWAYAGLFFDLIGAIYSVLAIHEDGWQFILLPLILGALSYFFYRKRLQYQKLRTAK